MLLAPAANEHRPELINPTGRSPGWRHRPREAVSELDAPAHLAEKILRDRPPSVTSPGFTFSEPGRRP